jgi:hypothetical protein
MCRWLGEVPLFFAVFCQTKIMRGCAKPFFYRFFFFFIATDDGV